MRYDAVLLDAGGVLLLPDHAVVGGALRASGLAPDGEQMDRAHYAAVQAVDRHGTADWDVYLTAYVRECGSVGPGMSEAVRRLDEALAPDVWLRPVAGAAEVLAQLAAAGVRIAVVSNSTGVVADLLRHDATRLCQVGPGPGVPVHAIIDSHDVGHDKPDPAIFHIALEATGVAADRTLFVGDTRHADIAGAAGVGIPGAHYDPYALCERQAGHVHVAHLREIADLVQQG